MVWGRFGRYLTRILLAKDLRTEVRRKGVAGLGHEAKSMLLEAHIAGLLRDQGEKHPVG